MSALLNLEGGVILLGVEKDRRIAGLTRSREEAEEWVMNIAQNNLQPAVLPVWSTVAMPDGTVVGAVELPADSSGKPHKARRGGAWVTFTRVGSTSREATREEEARLYQAAQLVRYEIKAVPDTGLEALDMDRVENYYRDVLKRSVPARSDLRSLAAAPAQLRPARRGGRRGWRIGFRAPAVRRTPESPFAPGGRDRGGVSRLREGVQHGR